MVGTGNGGVGDVRQEVLVRYWTHDRAGILPTRLMIGRQTGGGSPVIGRT